MEKIAPFLVNFDYESSLYDIPNKNKLRDNQEMEYIYFFIERTGTPLKNQKKYNEEYLNYLKTFGLNPVLSNSSNTSNWWGKFENKELEKKLNSKVESSNIFEKMHLNVSGTKVINSSEELQEGHFYRDPFDMSSRRSFIYQKKYPPQKIAFPLVGAPYVERILDLGVTLDLKNDTHFIVINKNNQKGMFKGASYLTDLSEFSFIDEKELLFHINEIKSEYQKLGAEDYLQIDFFYYKDNGEVKLAASEINYRKTMGLLAKSLYELSDGKKGAFLFERKGKIDDQNLIDLAPKDAMFSCLWCTHEFFINF